MASVGLLAGLLVAGQASTIGRLAGLIDKPDGLRKLHTLPTPLVGGLGLYLAAIIGLALGLSRAQADTAVIVSIFCAASLLFVIGVMDDRHGLPAWPKLLVGAAAISIAAALAPNLVVTELRFPFIGLTLPLGVLALPFTLFALLCLQHAANLADGKNGLFLGLCCLWLALLWPWLGHGMVHVLAPVAGALVPLLLANMRGRLFTGDSGVYLMTTLVGFAAIQAYVLHPELSALYMAACFLIPVLDMGRVMIIRAVRKSGVFRPGRDHLQHYLAELTGHNAMAVALYLLLCALPALYIFADMPATMIVILQVTGYVTLLAMHSFRIDRQRIH
jgi:UDP-GlcNAc:undecaprenyl-phosphate GlcNAc-1-phosphate transferase